MLFVNILIHVVTWAAVPPIVCISGGEAGNGWHCETAVLSPADSDVVATVLQVAISKPDFWQNPGLDRYVLSDCTLPAHDLQLGGQLVVINSRGRKEAVALDRSMMKQLTDRNRRPVKILFTTVDRRFQITDGETLTRLFEREGTEGWATFRTMFPTAAGIVRVGLPAFAADRDSALVLVSRSRGDLESEEALVAVRRTGAKWALEWYRIVAMS